MTLWDDARFRATAGTLQGFGATPHEALSALMAHVPDGMLVPITIWPFNQGDAFFTDEQHARLQALKLRVDTLTPDERAECERLVEAMFDAAAARTQ